MRIYKDIFTGNFNTKNHILVIIIDIFGNLWQFDSENGQKKSNRQMRQSKMSPYAMSFVMTAGYCKALCMNISFIDMNECLENSKWKFPNKIMMIHAVNICFAQIF